MRLVVIYIRLHLFLLAVMPSSGPSCKVVNLVEDEDYQDYITIELYS
jgi:hypothetical protein